MTSLFRENRQMQSRLKPLNYLVDPCLVPEENPHVMHGPPQIRKSDKV